jgi:NAD-dependent aldehyde dehydrogenases
MPLATARRLSRETPRGPSCTPISDFFIDGQWLNGDGRRGEDVINPATEKPLAHLPHASTADLEQALEAAKKRLRRVAIDGGL